MAESTSIEWTCEYVYACHTVVAAHDYIYTAYPKH